MKEIIELLKANLDVILSVLIVVLTNSLVLIPKLIGDAKTKKLLNTVNGSLESTISKNTLTKKLNDKLQENIKTVEAINSKVDVQMNEINSFITEEKNIVELVKNLTAEVSELKTELRRIKRGD